MWPKLFLEPVDIHYQIAQFINVAFTKSPEYLKRKQKEADKKKPCDKQKDFDSKRAFSYALYHPSGKLNKFESKPCCSTAIIAIITEDGFRAEFSINVTWHGKWTELLAENLLFDMDGHGI